MFTFQISTHAKLKSNSTSMDLQIASGEIDNVMRAQDQSNKTAHGYTGRAGQIDNAYVRMSREHWNRQLLGRPGMMLKNRTDSL